MVYRRSRPGADGLRAKVPSRRGEDSAPDVVAMSSEILVEAPAKVNLHLGVGSLRPDGYHDVETVLQTIDLADRLTLRSSRVFHLSCRPDVGVLARDNLVWRAAMLFAQRVGREPLVKVELAKAIPTGAGLGGGSSDAAAVIAALAAFWGVDQTDVLSDVASAIGADVPFFLGGGTALFSGRGDVFVRPISAPPLDLVVVKPSESVSTAAAYAAYDRAPVAPVSPDVLIAACEAGSPERLAAALSNNMERAAIGLVPEVAETLAWVRDAQGVLGGSVAGSGSAVFGVCVDHSAAEQVAREARLRGWWSAATMSRGDGVRVLHLKEAL